jgi:hypothetical protein
MSFDKYLVGLSIRGEGLSDRDIHGIEKTMNITFPNDYQDFLHTVNGCEGIFNGKNYAILWNGCDLQKYNQEYQVDEYLEGMLLIGSDGGGEAFAFDKLNGMIIVRVPFVGMDRDLAVRIADNFTALLSSLCTKALYE